MKIFIILALLFMTTSSFSQVVRYVPYSGLTAPRAMTLDDMRKQDQALIRAQNQRMIERSQIDGKQRRAEIDAILKEMKEDEKAKRKQGNYFESKTFLNSHANYLKSRKELEDQLSGAKPLSLKRAFYMTEWAFGNTYQSWDEFDRDIKQSTQYIKHWITENGGNINNSLHVNR